MNFVRNVIVAYSKCSLAQYLLQSILVAGGTAAGTALGVGPAVGTILGEVSAKAINSLAEYYAAGYTDQDFYDAYNQDASGIQSDLGTATITNSGLRLYFSVSGLKFSSNAVDDGSSGSFVSIHSSDLHSAYCQVNFNFLHAPCGGTYLPGYFVSGTCYGVNASPFTTVKSAFSILPSVSLQVDALLRQVTSYVVDCDKSWRLQENDEYDAWEMENATNSMALTPLRRRCWFVKDKDYIAYALVAVWLSSQATRIFKSTPPLRPAA